MTSLQANRVQNLNRMLVFSMLSAISLVTIALPIHVQNSPYSDTLLPAGRHAATTVPGDLPRSLHVLVFDRDHAPVSALIENGSPDTVAIAYPVFQILYSRG